MDVMADVARAGEVPLVEAPSVSKRYGETLALDDVTLRVRRGQSVAVVGETAPESRPWCG